MLDADVKIVRQGEDNTYDLTGKRTALVRVEFMVGDFGPFVERFPREGFSGSARDDKLNTFAREVRPR